MLRLYRPGFGLFAGEFLENFVLREEFIKVGMTEADGVFEGSILDNPGFAGLGLDQAFEFWELELAGAVAEGTPVVLMPGVVFEETAERFGLTVLTKQAEVLASYLVSNDAIEDVRLFAADTFHNTHLTTRGSISELSIEEGV
jgi:hypothetical protein